MDHLQSDMLIHVYLHQVTFRKDIFEYIDTSSDTMVNWGLSLCKVYDEELSRFRGKVSLTPNFS